MVVSRRQRFEILRRDNYTCRYCGARAPDVTLTVDHVIPTALGGSDDSTNLVTACRDCNAGKSSIAPDQPIVADVDAAALLFAKAIEKAAAIRRLELQALDALIDQFDAAWTTWHDSDNEPLHRQRDWRWTIERFLSLGLDVDDLTRYVTVAMNAGTYNDRTWRYFCGCCWNEIGRRQELARQLIEDGDA